MCTSTVEAHHLLHPWRGSRGVGLKADDANAIPLCTYHHQQLHTKYGREDTFFRANFREAEYGMELAEQLFQRFGPDK